ncbi:MAG: hypothetical protein PHW10_04425 [Candidatus Peribacteraceae bacterium]|nr:hypothetical protein [Candidatus Peribacteraceae bacterium]
MENPEFGQLSRYCAITTNPAYVELGRSFAERIRCLLEGRNSGAPRQAEVLGIVMGVSEFDEHLGLLGFALDAYGQSPHFGPCVNMLRENGHKLRNGFLPLAGSVRYLPPDSPVTVELRTALHRVCEMIGAQQFSEQELGFPR